MKSATFTRRRVPCPDTKYIGPCYESFQAKDGTVSMQKLYMYYVRGERRYALTEEAAKAAVR